MDAPTRSRYIRQQWKTLLVLIVGYTCSYFLRKNFSAAIPAIHAMNFRCWSIAFPLILQVISNKLFPGSPAKDTICLRAR